jgi:hypothetical protein
VVAAAAAAAATVVYKINGNHKAESYRGTVKHITINAAIQTEI